MAFVAIVGLQHATESTTAAQESVRNGATSQSTYSHRFPDSNSDYVPPTDEYMGPLFRLSQSFPTQPQRWDTGLQRIMEMPFGPEDEAWKHYLLMVRDYCFEGNIPVEFQGQDNTVRPWYHVPWQHWGRNGREAIHGLTREATAQPQQLAPGQSRAYQTYAVGMYNSVGAYTIGSVWQNEMQPNPTVAKFPQGTIVFKILFTQAPPQDVPYLQNPITWKAYAEQSDNNPKRTVQDVNLIQMDVMIRDDRVASTGGWIFGNFCYNGALDKENPWHNLVPVGIAWGDDPTVTSDPRKLNSKGQPFPPQTTFNEQLTQVIINPGEELPPQHLGWGGRLNGPLDYYNSSCMSCHSTAEYPALAPMNPQFTGKDIPPGSKTWMRWFRNLDCGVPFTANKAYSTDYSLQLAISLQNFYEWKSGTQDGFFNPAVVKVMPPTDTLGVQALAIKAAAEEADDLSEGTNQVFKIRRGPEQ
jgi:hypothetical protein